ncbi:DUF1702 family protein [Nonomuraea sp. NPDC050310]|uniref:DUF1702 family protein n=1 Tax=Nonomuraea sp. NPDC050310 TaxID=3154935 RepID=UPI00340D32F9
MGAPSLLDQLWTEPTPAAPRGLRRLLALDADRAGLARRRFRLRPGPAREILERAERSCILGFNSALAEQPHLIDQLPPDQRGFACEGAAAASALLDLVTLTRGRRLHELLAGPAVHHPHAVYVGAGRAYARLPLRPGFARLHPLHRWAALDGLGFEHGLADADRAVGERVQPRVRGRDEQALADQGLGRLLWVHECAAPDDVAARIGSFPAPRRGDLWSGAGFAATQVGGADSEELCALAFHASADGFRAHLAQGSAFAAAAWLRSGHLPLHTVQASILLAGAEPDEAAARVDRALIGLGHDPRTAEDYLAWRAHTRRAFTRR